MNNALGRPRKKKIVSRAKAYHGVTVATASLTGLPINQTDFDVPIANIVHTSCPHHYRCALPGESEREFSARLARELEELILREDPETVAAFIVEPVMGAGGVIVPPAEYFEAVMPVCVKYDLYVICDEVICGFGRLGTMFGCQALGFRPHSLSVAKALTSAYVPMGAVTVPEAMYQAMLDQARKIGPFGHGFTYSGHPVAAAVALKTLEIFERDRIVEQAAEKIPQFQARLAALAAHPLVGEARGLGLVGAVELVADKTTKRSFAPKDGVGVRAMALAEEEGLLVRALAGDVLSICPPLVIAPEEIHALFDRLGRALDRTLAWARAERVLGNAS
jgi:4-aminobutyrate--pyruvate transaminase